MKQLALFALAIIVWGCQTTHPGVAPALSLPALFSDGMVLQQGRPVAVWGKAVPGTRIRVSLGHEHAKALSNEQGYWQANLGPFAANATGQDLVVTAGSSRHVVRDVLIGEVWLCSGQSNMAMTMQPGPRAILNVEQELASANYPAIRLFDVPRATKFEPQDDTPGAKWVACSPESVKTFSAVGYFFGRELGDAIKVPIGLINASYGGSPVEAWEGDDALRRLGEWRPVMDMLPKLIADSATRAGEYKKQSSKWFVELDSFDLGYDNGKPLWAEPTFDDTAWTTMDTPGYWEDKGFPSLDGFGWYRKVIDVPAAWASKPLRLHLTGFNDMDRTWFNGELVGQFEGTSGFSNPRDYPVPVRLVHAGPNVIAVRVYDLGNNGGFLGAASDMHLDLENANVSDSIPLAGPWRFKPGMDMASVPAKPVEPVYVEGNQRIPTVLFNAMIAPLVPYGLRGVIWYQGEGNVGRARQYEALFPNLINDWRMRFRQGDLPFYFVQLAAYKPATDDPNAPSPIAELREAQTRALVAPNTGMAVTIDIGDAENIHPRNKQDVGKRLALQALKHVYEKDVVADGPAFQSVTVSGNTATLNFANAQGGLRTRDNSPLRGFAVAGNDENYYWADAKIEGDRVALVSDKVQSPRYVRYAWAENPVANLCNASGLPAAPFRANVK